VGDSGALLGLSDCPERSRVQELESLPKLTAECSRRTAVLLNGNINHDFDIEATLRSIRSKLSRTSRVILIAYNPYFRLLYSLANRFGVRTGDEPTTFVTQTDLNNLAKLSGFEVVRVRPAAYCPFRLFGVGNLINRVLPAIPLLRALSLTSIVVLRPVIADAKNPSLSIVIPARNERDNIENAIKRMPTFDGADLEVLFVEGHSRDGTWQEIQRVMAAYEGKVLIRAMQQTGKGKSDAVRLGFEKATKDLLLILDADLTMPPELLVRFVEAYRAGLADFINGSRLVYPMESKAMRFLNRLGNVFFAKALSSVLGVRLGDSLCGTKVVARHDYQRMCAWRNDFGDFDPFGDFELLFPAAELALGILDVPIRYRDRVYGTTQIQRFYHGAMLFKMTAIGFLRVKLGKSVG
jgi:hypothetical protein